MPQRRGPVGARSTPPHFAPDPPPVGLLGSHRYLRISVAVITDIGFFDPGACGEKKRGQKTPISSQSE